MKPSIRALKSWPLVVGAMLQVGCASAPRQGDESPARFRLDLRQSIAECTEETGFSCLRVLVRGEAGREVRIGTSTLAGQVVVHPVHAVFERRLSTGAWEEIVTELGTYSAPTRFLSVGADEPKTLVVPASADLDTLLEAGQARLRLISTRGDIGILAATTGPAPDAGASSPERPCAGVSVRLTYLGDSPVRLETHTRGLGRFKILNTGKYELGFPATGRSGEWFIHSHSLRVERAAAGGGWTPWANILEEVAPSQARFEIEPGEAETFHFDTLGLLEDIDHDDAVPYRVVVKSTRGCWVASQPFFLQRPGRQPGEATTTRLDSILRVN